MALSGINEWEKTQWNSWSWVPEPYAAFIFDLCGSQPDAKIEVNKTSHWNRSVTVKGTVVLAQSSIVHNGKIAAHRRWFMSYFGDLVFDE